MPRFYCELCVWLDAKDEDEAKRVMQRIEDAAVNEVGPTGTASVNSVEVDDSSEN